MFKPITARQAAYLARLIAAAGKKQYQAAKRRLGFPHVTVMNLSKSQASRLISALAGRDGKR